MQAVFTLTPAEAKRLIAKAVAGMEVVQKALKKGKVVIAMGTTNAYVAEEILGGTIEKQRFTFGIVTQGLHCATPDAERLAPIVLKDGVPVQMRIDEAVDSFERDDVFIKGANAVDPMGHAGILLGNLVGGTIGSFLGRLAARGSHLIIPVGLEKMIPSVIEASKVCGIARTDLSLGMPVGYMPLVNANVVTEITALETMFGVKAVHIASGGIGGSEGAVTLAIQGEEDRVREAFAFVRKIKGEKALPTLRRKCSECPNPCDFSRR